MSAYKKLNKQDAFVTPYIAHKQWTIKSEEFTSYGIDKFTAVSASEGITTTTSTTSPTLKYDTLVFPTWYGGMPTTSSYTIVQGKLWVEVTGSGVYGSTDTPIAARIHNLDLNNENVATVAPDWTTITFRVGQTYGGGQINITADIVSSSVHSVDTYFELANPSTASSGSYSVFNKTVTPTPAYGITTVTTTDLYPDLFNPATDLTSGTSSTQYRRLIHQSLQHLYYSLQPGGIRVSGSYVNYDQTTLFASSSRNLPVSASVYSIPRAIYGNAIKPGTFVIEPQPEQNYVSSSYVSGGYIYEASDIINAIDDGEGNIIHQGSFGGSGRKIGDIIYPHGIVVITDPNYDIYTDAWVIKYQLKFQSSLDIFTHQYRCKVRESEMSLTYNPSALTGSNGMLHDNVTGSYFSPYVTTIGLYNDAHELVAVGKLGQPVPKSQNNDMTFVVNFDI